MHFIGIDVHKHICTAVVIDENEKIIAECDDFPTTEKGLDEFISNFDPNGCRIVFENLTHATSSSITCIRADMRSMSSTPATVHSRTSLR